MQSIRFIQRMLLALGLSLCIATAHAQLTAGKDYTLVKPPQPTDSGNKIEVLEFFWYGCPHCYHLQPSMEAWLKHKPADVELRRIPAVFQDSWIPLTKAYYTIETMGLVDKLHQEMFNALHRQRLPLVTPESIFDWAATKGVDRKKFADVYNSFGINGRTQRSIELTRKFDIPGTPALVIDGKYLTSPGMALKGKEGDKNRPVDYEKLFQTVDSLIAEARKSKGSK